MRAPPSRLQRARRASHRPHQTRCGDIVGARSFVALQKRNTDDRSQCFPPRLHVVCTQSTVCRLCSGSVLPSTGSLRGDAFGFGNLEQLRSGCPADPGRKLQRPGPCRHTPCRTFMRSHQFGRVPGSALSSRRERSVVDPCLTTTASPMQTSFRLATRVHTRLVELPYMRICTQSALEHDLTLPYCIPRRWSDLLHPKHERRARAAVQNALHAAQPSPPSFDISMNNLSRFKMRRCAGRPSQCRSPPFVNEASSVGEVPGSGAVSSRLDLLPIRLVSRATRAAGRQGLAHFTWRLVGATSLEPTTDAVHREWSSQVSRASSRRGACRHCKHRVSRG